ncbi:MAG: hypothetical protein AVDCRST_MAG68-878, partial [uncultured Gemmatimonadetes bacterium]
VPRTGLLAPALPVRARRPLPGRAGGRRAPRGLLLHHQPPHLRPPGRRVAAPARPAHGLRPGAGRGRRAPRGGSALRARRAARGHGLRRGRLGGDLRAHHGAGGQPGPGARGRVQIHVVRGLAREADGLQRDGAHPGGRAGARRAFRVGGGPRRPPFAGPRHALLVHPQRLRGRALRRQRGGRARHRVGHHGHHAGDERAGRAAGGGARLPYARHQPGARGGLHPRGGGAGGRHRRHHARPGDPRRPLRPGRVHPRRRAAAGHHHRRDRGAGDDEGAHAPRHGGDDDRHGAALHRHRQHAPLLRLPRGDGGGAPHDHHLRGLVGVPGLQAQGPRHPPGIRRHHQRAGLPPRPAPLRGDRGRRPPARRSRL